MKNSLFKKGTILVIIILFIGASIIPLTSSKSVEKSTAPTLDDPTIVSIQPSTTIVGPGETFDVDIYIEPGEPIIGANVDILSFNPNLVHGNSRTYNGYFPDASFCPGIIDNLNGEFRDICELIYDDGDVSTPGTWVTISFTAQQQYGTSSLDLEGVIVSDVNGDPVPIEVNNGIVTVEPDPTIVSIQPPVTIVGKGEIFDVDVYIEPGEPIIGANFDYLYYDPDIIHGVGGSDWGYFPSPFGMWFHFDNVNGKFYDVYQLIYGPGNVSTPGTWVSLTFTAQQQYGTSLLDLEGVIVSDTTGTPVPLIVNDGIVHVAMDEDVNMDGEVHFEDLVAVSLHYGEEGDPGWIREDVNNDGIVHFMDLVQITMHYNEVW